MPMISIIEECYQQLEKMKKELVEQKKAQGQPVRTTFSEVVFKLIQERRI